MNDSEFVPGSFVAIGDFTGILWKNHHEAMIPGDYVGEVPPNTFGIVISRSPDHSPGDLYVMFNNGMIGWILKTDLKNLWRPSNEI